MPIWLSITMQLLGVVWGLLAALWVNRRVHIDWQYGGALNSRVMNATFRFFVGIIVFMAATTAVFPLLFLLNATYP
jgi:hypothetical protein